MTAQEEIDLLKEDIAHIRHDINSMRQELKNYQVLMNDRSDAVNRLIYLLEGDKLDTNRGFISRLIALERFADTVKNTKAYVAGNIAASVFILTAIGGIIAGLFKLYTFFKH